MSKKILLVFIITCLCSCRMEDDVHAIWFDNNSCDSIWIYMAMSFYGHTPTAYPDTLLPHEDCVEYRESQYDDFISSYIPIVPPNSKGWIWDAIGSPDIYFHRILPFDTLSVFVISNDSIKKYGYDNIAKSNNILVRYDLSIPDMKSLGYIFPYPPSPQMKDMKMYPPFEEIISAQ